MSTKIESKTKPAPKRARRQQERTETTRRKLLDAAIKIFSEQGFDGVSVRDLETAAGVQRGLLAYHFDDKESLWKAAADRTFTALNEEVQQRVEIMRDLVPRERIKALIRFYVRFSARHPEFSRLLSQEARQHSWRIEYLVDRYINNIVNALRDTVMEELGLDEIGFIHWYYLLAGGASTIFSHAPECDLLYGVDSLDEAIVEGHADMLARMLMSTSDA